MTLPDLFISIIAVGGLLSLLYALCNFTDIPEDWDDELERRRNTPPGPRKRK